MQTSSYENASEFKNKSLLITKIQNHCTNVCDAKVLSAGPFVGLKHRRYKISSLAHLASPLALKRKHEHVSSII